MVVLVGVELYRAVVVVSDQSKTEGGKGSNMSAAPEGLEAAVTKPGNCVREVYLGDTRHVIKHTQL